MSTFEATLKYTKDELETVMREKHGISNLVIRKAQDATGIISFLLEAIGSEGLGIYSEHDATIEDQDVFVRVQNGSYGDGWSERVQHTLRRLDDHIKTKT